jgi:hypothetical protein
MYNGIRTVLLAISCSKAALGKPFIDGLAGSRAAAVDCLNTGAVAGFSGVLIPVSVEEITVTCIPVINPCTWPINGRAASRDDCSRRLMVHWSRQERKAFGSCYRTLRVLTHW